MVTYRGGGGVSLSGIPGPPCAVSADGSPGNPLPGPHRTQGSETAAPNYPPSLVAMARRSQYLLKRRRAWGPTMYGARIYRQRLQSRAP